MNHLIGKVINAQDRQQTIHNDFIHAFMANDTIPRVIVRQLVIDFSFSAFFISLQERTGRTGGMAYLFPTEITQVRKFMDDLIQGRSPP